MNRIVLGVRVLLQLSTRMLGSVAIPALLILQRINMDSVEYPQGLPDNMKPEYKKYLLDPRKYARMYPVCHKILLKYIGTPNGKKED